MSGSGNKLTALPPDDNICDENNVVLPVANIADEEYAELPDDNIGV